MTILKDINEFLANRRLAMVGVSRNDKAFSRSLMRDLLARGYDVVPINPKLNSVEDRVCYPRVSEIENPVTAAIVMARAANLGEIARDCALAGIKSVWIVRSQGDRVERVQAIRLLEENLITVIDGQCPFMFLPDTVFMHRFHGRIARFFGKFPQ
jgi:uncharacterized protein